MNRPPLATLVTLILALCCATVLAQDEAEEEAPALLGLAQLELRQVAAVAYYACPRGAQCVLRCAAGADQVAISYNSVLRLEIGEAEAERLVGIAYVDATGRNRVATAFFPKPSSCSLDDLVLEGIEPVEEGNVVRPHEDSDVVFEVQRSH